MSGEGGEGICLPAGESDCQTCTRSPATTETTNSSSAARSGCCPGSAVMIRVDFTGAPWEIICQRVSSHQHTDRDQQTSTFLLREERASTVEEGWPPLCCLQAHGKFRLNGTSISRRMLWLLTFVPIEGRIMATRSWPCSDYKYHLCITPKTPCQPRIPSSKPVSTEIKTTTHTKKAQPEMQKTPPKPSNPHPSSQPSSTSYSSSLVTDSSSPQTDHSSSPPAP